MCCNPKLVECAYYCMKFCISFQNILLKKKMKCLCKIVPMAATSKKYIGIPQGHMLEEVLVCWKQRPGTEDNPNYCIIVLITMLFASLYEPYKALTCQGFDSPHL